jgi:hypothetical protein
LDPYRRGATVYLGGKINPDQIGLTVVAQFDPGEGEETADQAVANRLETLFDQYRPTRIGINSFIGQSLMHLLARKRLPIEDMKANPYFTACRVFDELINTGRIIQDGNPTADQHIQYAAREELKNGSGWFISRKLSPGPIHGADGAAMCAYLATRPTNPKRLAVAVAG